MACGRLIRARVFRVRDANGGLVGYGVRVCKSVHWLTLEVARLFKIPKLAWILVKVAVRNIGRHGYLARVAKELVQEVEKDA